jgi:hypothetical protein
MLCITFSFTRGAIKWGDTSRWACFKIREFSADKAYGSLDNYATIEEAGGTPFIAFKSNHTGAVGGGL